MPRRLGKRYMETIDEVLPKVDKLDEKLEQKARLVTCKFVLENNLGPSVEVASELLSMLGLLPNEELKSSQKKR